MAAWCTSLKGTITIYHCINPVKSSFPQARTYNGREHHKGHPMIYKHPGFKKAAEMMASKQGMPMKRAKAILAAGARKASPAAIKKNPRLKKVLRKKK